MRSNGMTYSWVAPVERVAPPGATAASRVNALLRRLRSAVKRMSPIIRGDSAHRGERSISSRNTPHARATARSSRYSSTSPNDDCHSASSSSPSRKPPARSSGASSPTARQDRRTGRAPPVWLPAAAAARPRHAGRARRYVRFPAGCPGADGCRLPVPGLGHHAQREGHLGRHGRQAVGADRPIRRHPRRTRRAAVRTRAGQARKTQLPERAPHGSWRAPTMTRVELLTPAQIHVICG